MLDVHTSDASKNLSIKYIYVAFLQANDLATARPPQEPALGPVMQVLGPLAQAEEGAGAQLGTAGEAPDTESQASPLGFLKGLLQGSSGEPSVESASDTPEPPTSPLSALEELPAPVVGNGSNGATGVDGLAGVVNGNKEANLVSPAGVRSSSEEVIRELLGLPGTDAVEPPAVPPGCPPSESPVNVARDMSGRDRAAAPGLANPANKPSPAAADQQRQTAQLLAGARPFLGISAIVEGLA